MNKTTLFIVFAILAALGLCSYVVVLVLVPAHAAAFVGTLISILAIVSGSATTFYMLGKNQTTLEQVKTQTNGITSKLQEQLVERDAQIAQKDATIAVQANQLLAVVGASPSVGGGDHVAR